MAVYRGNDADGVFFTARRDEASKRDPNYSEVAVPTTQKDLLPFLTALANEVRDVPVRENEPEQTENIPVTVPVREISHAEQLVAFEDAWEGMPLARQLHFASLATERARYAIKEKTQ